MKQLTCELCGSTELIKQDGFFVCQGCGTKYSPEEARKLLAEAGDAPAPQSVTKQDHSEDIARLLNLASNAFEVRNFDETLTYTARILELDDTNYRALYMKGTATLWQSTTARPRIKDAELYWSEALRYVPLETPEAEKLCKDIVREYCAAVSALKVLYLQQINSVAELFSAPQSIIELNQKWLIGRVSMTACYNVRLPEDQRSASAARVLSKGEVVLPLSEFRKFLDRVSERAYSQFRIYRGGNLGPSGQEAYRLLVNSWIPYACLERKDQVAALEYAKKIYQQAKTVLRQCEFTTQGIDQSIDKVNNAIRETEVKVREERKKERKKRLEEYWKEHSQEKEELETRKAETEGEIRKINSAIAELEDSRKQVPALKDRYDICLKIDVLTNRKKSLGIFSGKEKKALQEQIDALHEERRKQENIIDRQRQPIDEEIATKQKELDAWNRTLRHIETELTRDR